MITRRWVIRVLVADDMVHLGRGDEAALGAWRARFRGCDGGGCGVGDGDTACDAGGDNVAAVGNVILADMITVEKGRDLWFAHRFRWR